MLVRLLVSGAVACGLLASGSAFADSAAARVLKGRTAQGYAIKVNAKPGMLKLVRFEADLKCAKGGGTLTLIESGFLWTDTGAGGSFKDAQFGKTDSVYFRGTASAKKVTGKLRLTDKERGSPKCSSRWISFTAR